MSTPVSVSPKVGAASVGGLVGSAIGAFVDYVLVHIPGVAALDPTLKGLAGAALITLLSGVAAFVSGYLKSAEKWAVEVVEKGGISAGTAGALSHDAEQAISELIAKADAWFETHTEPSPLEAKADAVQAGDAKPDALAQYPKD